MRRPHRLAWGGYVYHVLNRANARLPLFKKEGDYAAFERILGQATCPTCTFYRLRPIPGVGKIRVPVCLFQARGGLTNTTCSSAR